MTDPTNPPHYQSCSMQVIDIIDAFSLDFNEGNALKYLLRWRKKGGVEDLKKCKWYVDRLINGCENE